jgi:hypothetical protein
MRRCLLIAGLIEAGVLSSALPAGAMTLHEVEKTCPYDGTKFKFTEQGSGTSFDKTLDLMAVGAIQSPWPIAVCPTNGFVFLKEKYEDADLERLRPIVLSAEYQATKDETPYYRAAWISEHDGGEHAKVSWLLLQATWEVGNQEMRDRYAARPKDAPEPNIKDLWAEGTRSERYRRYATELLARLPADIAAAGDASDTYRMLAGELLRRLGRFEEAEAHFAAYATTVDPAKWLAKVIAYERDLIAKRDIGIHFFSQVPK